MITDMNWRVVAAAGGSLGALSLLWSFWCRIKSTVVKDKVVVITGASSGIGEACAHEFYKAGAKLILCARRMHELERVSSELKTKYKSKHDVYNVHLDLENIESLPKTAEEILSHYGHVDILINNSGISNRADVLSSTVEAELKVFQVNVLGTIAFTKALIPSMVKRKTGHIVLVGSLQGKFALPNRACYGGSKHAVHGYFDSLRAELHDFNINVTIMVPSYVKTNLSIHAVTADGSLHGKQCPNEQSGMTGEYLAHRIERAITCKRNEVTIAPLHHQLVVYIRLLCPCLYYWLVNRRATKERRNAEKSK